MRWFKAPMPRWRRIITIAVILAFALLLGRDFMVEGLVARADQLVRAGDGASAVAYLRRALVIDPSEPNAAQRLGYLAELTHNRALILEAIGHERAAMLRRHPEALAMTYASDLALLGEYGEAENVWASLAAGSVAHSKESDLYVLWAAESARMAKDCPHALQFYREHLVINPRDTHAQALVRTLQGRCG